MWSRKYLDILILIFTVNFRQFDAGHDFKIFFFFFIVFCVMYLSAVV